LKYPEYKQINHFKLEQEILDWWEMEKIFERSVSEREGNHSYTFYEGPPSANGTPGIHHVMARTVKDIFCRYKTQKGFQVKRKSGWDTHGLPVELQVEKELGITKEDIGKSISVEDYNDRCKKAVMKYKGEWEDLTRIMAYWVDLDSPYITFKRDYVESLWFILKTLFDKGLLYEGYSVQPFSPAAGTGLSSHELNMPGTYKMVKDTSIVAQFKVKNEGPGSQLFSNPQEEVFFLAWTTTPWTLPSNCALAMGESISYSKVKTYNPYTYRPISVILASELLPKFFDPKSATLNIKDYKPGDREIPWKEESNFIGKELEGILYEQLMPYISNEDLEQNAFRVIFGDFVTTEEGTGIVHTASVFGVDDFRVAQKNGVPAVMITGADGKKMPLVDKRGKFVPEVTDFAGRFVRAEYEDPETLQKPDFKSTDVLIAIKLKEQNRAFKVEKYEHSYPHCWRTDKPVLYYPLDSWFIKTTALKSRMVELNKTINWKPASTGQGRFGNWLENLVDWNLSRSRFWGTPLPIWKTRDEKEVKCIGSVEELINESGKSVDAGLMKKVPEDGIDLHRPYVDEIILCSDTGQPMYREPALIDVWFDSGAMPMAQWHYPFENKDVFQETFPADFIAEGVDQTRGWFFTLHAISTLLFDKVAFKNVIANGLVLDKEGNKMSKRLGNAVDPFKTIEKYGADATRWYMVENAPPWENLKFDEEGILEIQRRFFGTLSNTYQFFALYANIDGFSYKEDDIPISERTELDRWILSKLNHLNQTVLAAYEDYEPTRAARAIQNFTINDLSNWYVRLSRKRFWVGEFTRDKLAAYQTLYTALMGVLKLAAPIAPFLMERYYKDLNSVTGKENFPSVHLSIFPDPEQGLIDKVLEKKMGWAQKISSLVHSIRKKEKIKVRQPLQKLLLPPFDKDLQKYLGDISALIRNEVNIKNIEIMEEGSNIITKKAKPNFRKLGQTYGSLMKQISIAVSKLDNSSIVGFEEKGSLQVLVDGREITLTGDELLIETQDIPGWAMASDSGITVALDISLSEELRREGLARDVVNRVQNLRKARGLGVQDKIRLGWESEDKGMNEAFSEFSEYISREIQAIEIINKMNGLEFEEMEIDGIKIKMGLEKV
jgi:isoleucyl-tRNA synthetase